MSIVSFNFYIFVCAILFLYYICPKKIKWCVLLVASTTFFLLASGLMLFLIMFATSLVVYGGAIQLDRLKQYEEEKSEQGNKNQKLEEKKLSKVRVFHQNPERGKRIILATVIIILAIVLILFKEMDFFVNNANLLVRISGRPLLQAPKWIAPLGISYYTLILIGYILDVAWGASPAQRNPLKFLLFTSYFPQMISGPFSRYKDMEKALFEGATFSYKDFTFGIQRMLWGLFKKLVLAERLAVIVGTVYGSFAEFGEFTPHRGLYIVLAAIAYVFQIYMDFSGCMDIVLGVSEMFGIKMAENFRTPFYSTNLSEVWRRWHITLGFWLKDYVMYPVLKSHWMNVMRLFVKKRFGKKVSRKIPTYIGMFITWFLVGFWHGGTWRYIFASGLFFFGMIVGGMLLEPLFNKMIVVLKINTQCFGWMVFQRTRTFLLFALSISFGRVEQGLRAGFAFWRSAFDFNPWILFDHSLYSLGLDRQDFWVVIFGLAVVAVISYLQQRGSVREKLAEQNLVFRWIILLVLFFVILILGMYGENYNPADFIYGGF